jgi:hypothetical protein
VFTDPQLATVGERFPALDQNAIVTGTVSFENQGRARVMLRNRGLLHVYAEVATGLVLGAEMIGPDAEHIAHLLAWGVQSELTVARMLEMPFYHPVVEEGLRTALRDADEVLGLRPDMAALEAISRRLGALGVTVHAPNARGTLGPWSDAPDIAVRSFAPATGVPRGDSASTAYSSSNLRKRVRSVSVGAPAAARRDVYIVSFSTNQT